MPRLPHGDSDADGSETAADPAADADSESDGCQLTIDLQDGFSNDEVEIRVDGDVVYSSEDVTTKLLYGLADSVAVSVGADATEVEVTVESADRMMRRVVDVNSGVFLGVSATPEGIEVIQAREAFGYG